MDEHGLPIVGAGVDYTKVPPLEHRSTLALLNHFIVHTTKFLNRFSSVCEERLSDLYIRLQRLDISLNILESKLASIDGLEGVQATTQYEPPAAVAAAGATGNVTSQPASTAAAAPVQPSSSSGQAPPPPPPGDSGEPIPPPQPAEEQSQVMKIKDDPRYKPFFKMKRLGVSPLQLQMEMKRKGLDPDLLEDEDAPAPSGAPGSTKADAGYSKGGGSSDSSDESSTEEEDDDDDSFGSD